MDKKRRDKVTIPATGMDGDERSAQELKPDEDPVQYRKQFRRKLGSTVLVLMIAAAVAVLIASLLMPVLKIYGTSMEPALTEDSIVVAVRTSNFHTGDIIAFEFSNKTLVKRVIALPGESVDIDEAGNVFINGELLDEPYLEDPAMAECDIELPYLVPDGKLFVLGDQRSVSQDSRLQIVGCVEKEQIVGKVLFTLWSP